MTPLEIKAARVELGLTQAELAESVGVGRSSIIAWEKGEHSPPKWFGLALTAYAEGLAAYRPSLEAQHRAGLTQRIDPRFRRGMPGTTLSGGEFSLYGQSGSRST